MAVSRKEFIEALWRRQGVRALVARDLGVGRSAVDRRIARTAIFQETLQEIEATQLDLAEAMLLEAVARGDSWAIRLFLTTKGKDRGYSLRTELPDDDGAAIDVESLMKELNVETAKHLKLALEAGRRRD